MCRRTGDYSEEGPPVPIPNTEVKLFSSDDTLGAAPRENRTSPFHPPTWAVFCRLKIIYRTSASFLDGENVRLGSKVLRSIVCLSKGGGRRTCPPSSTSPAMIASTKRA